MDDPWGSPWADESSHPLPKVDKLSSKRSATSEKVLGVSQSSKSPWDDDDGFGEWAPLPATDELQVNEQNGPEQAEIAKWNAPISEKISQEKDQILPDGSTWFSREIQYTDGGGLGSATSKANGRALSPDPWAEEVAEAKEKVRSSCVPELNSLEESTITRADQDGAQTSSTILQDKDENVIQDVNELEKADPSNIGEKASIGKSFSNHDQDEPTIALDNVVMDVQVNGAIRGESLASRPSSSPSDHSNHDEVLTESPRTSFEEEDKRPKLEMESCSKAKKMVRLFDDLARAEDSIELPQHSQSANATDDRHKTPIAGDSEDDFGDFEEGDSYVTPGAVAMEETTTKEDGSPVRNSDVHGVSTQPTSTEQPPTNISEKPLMPHALVQFESNLSLLGPLFGHKLDDADFAHADPKRLTEMDNVIQDSFSSTDERKTWYRISRYSTMRKHNSGDEDSYVRVNWKNSQVRAETLKIVERWIEEDQIGGGAILSGGTRLGSMFGWGQKNAAPMSVAAALASRSGKAEMHSDYAVSPTSFRSADASTIHGSESSRKSLEQIAASRNSFHSPLSATVPQFSWSSGTPISATAGATLPVPPLVPENSSLQAVGNSYSSSSLIKESLSRKREVSEDPSSIPIPFSNQRTKPSAGNFIDIKERHSIQMAPEPPKNRSDLDADDEWGEMISSPAFENTLPIAETIKSQKNSHGTKLLSTSLVPNSPFLSSNHTSERRPIGAMTAPQRDNQAFLASGFENQTNKPKVTAPSASNSDAWATADFSFFDTPVPSKSAPTPPAPAPKVSTPAPVPIRHNQGISKEKAEQDRIVKNIVQNLPDLSYMFRR